MLKYQRVEFSDTPIVRQTHLSPKSTTLASETPLPASETSPVVVKSSILLVKSQYVLNSKSDNFLLVEFQFFCC